MTSLDDSRGPEADPDRFTPIGGGAGLAADSIADPVADPAEPAAPAEAVPMAPPPPPVDLWPGEQSLDRHAPAGPDREQLAAAVAEIRAAIATAEAGGEPIPGPAAPATLDELVTAAGRLAEPLGAAFAGDAADAPGEPGPARAALDRAITGWVLAVLAGRLGLVARRHGRSLMPGDLAAGAEDFTGRHVASARAGHGVDRTFLRQSLPRVRAIVDAAWWQLAGTGGALEAVPPPRQRSLVVLLEHARARLIRLEHWHYETCLVDPPPAGMASWRIAAATRLGRLAWHAPAGPPPRPVIDDVTEPPADPAADEDVAASSRLADPPARADDAA